MIITTVTSEKELDEIHALNKASLKFNLSEEEKKQEGFVTWLYSPELLRQMHSLQPSIIAKDGDRVVGYALVTPREARAFHTDLETMINHTQDIPYKGLPLIEHNYYIMGQICIDKDYRGKGLFRLLYEKHKELYSGKYDMLVTEVSTNNKRSQAAHEKVGFVTINTYPDAEDEWNVVVWDWRG